MGSKTMACLCRDSIVLGAVAAEHGRGRRCGSGLIGLDGIGRATHSEAISVDRLGSPVGNHPPGLS